MKVITLKFTLISLLLSLITALSVSSQAQAALPNLKQITTGFEVSVRRSSPYLHY